MGESTMAGLEAAWNMVTRLESTWSRASARRSKFLIRGRTTDCTAEEKASLVAGDPVGEVLLLSRSEVAGEPIGEVMLLALKDAIVESDRGETFPNPSGVLADSASVTLEHKSSFHEKQMRCPR